jgi:probable HAF family extracellular repeat protein
MKLMHSPLILTLLLLVASLGAPNPTTAAEYSIQVLNATEGDIDSVAFALNNLGQVVGDSKWSRSGAVGASHPMLWSDGEPGVKVWQSDNPFFRLGGIGMDINDNGQIVGRAGSGDMMPLPGPGVRPGAAVVWDATNGLRYLGTLGGSSEALEINNAGQIVGSSQNELFADRAFLWTEENGMQDLGTLGGLESRGNGINSFGQVVGYSTRSDGFEHAFIWDSVAGMIDLAPDSVLSSRAWGINDQGQIVGEIQGAIRSAFVWDSQQGLQILDQPGARFSSATAINNAGQILGAGDPSGLHPELVLWDPINGLRALTDLIPADSGWQLEFASDINDRGQIVGYGYINGEVRGFLMTPVPEPSTLVLVGTGAVAIVAFAARRRTAK